MEINCENENELRDPLADEHKIECGIRKFEIRMCTMVLIYIALQSTFSSLF